MIVALSLQSLDLIQLNSCLGVSCAALRKLLSPLTLTFFTCKMKKKKKTRKRRKVEILQEDGAKIKDGKFVH